MWLGQQWYHFGLGAPPTHSSPLGLRAVDPWPCLKKNSPTPPSPAPKGGFPGPTFGQHEKGTLEKLGCRRNKAPRGKSIQGKNLAHALESRK